jgi:hypothetical protein
MSNGFLQVAQNFSYIVRKQLKFAKRLLLRNKNSKKRASVVKIAYFLKFWHQVDYFFGLPVKNSEFMQKLVKIARESTEFVHRPNSLIRVVSYIGYLANKT